MNSIDRRRQYRRLVILAVASFLCLATAIGHAGPLNETPVRATREGEWQPVGADGFLGWQENTRRHPNRFNAYIKPTGEPRFKVNDAGTRGAMGGIDGATLVFQEFRFNPDVSDISMLDLSTRTRMVVPSGINTGRWEYFPSLSGDWVLFGRQALRSGSRTIVLHNVVTSVSRDLASVKSPIWLGPGQVNGNYAVWDKCTRRACNVFLYDIAADTKSQIPNPGRFQYSPAVSATGTVFFARHGNSCADRAAIFRRPLGGASTRMVRAASGHDVGQLYAWTSTDGETHVFYNRYVFTSRCRIPSTGSDIFKVVDPPAPPTGTRDAVRDEHLVRSSTGRSYVPTNASARLPHR
jgi:hypothetical protein